MKMVLVACRDRALGAFMQPFFAQSEGVAIRSFGDEIQRDAPDNLLHKHPDDYSLYAIAVFDDVEGELNECTPRLIASGSQFNGGRNV